MLPKFLNGQSEHYKAMDARHFDKRLIFRLVLWVLFVQLSLLVFFTTSIIENQRALSLVTRMSDNLGNVVLTLIGALVGIIRGAQEGARAGDRGQPPTPQPASPPEDKP